MKLLLSPCGFGFDPAIYETIFAPISLTAFELFSSRRTVDFAAQKTGTAGEIRLCRLELA
jgi:hypothetical protein